MNGIDLPPPRTPDSRQTIRTPSPQRPSTVGQDSFSPRRRNTVGQDSRGDWSFASFASSRVVEKQTGYEDVVKLLDTVASATLEERTLTDTYETRIRELEAENAELLRENEELLVLLRSTDTPPSTQTTKALATIRSLQDTLISEREGFGVREASLTARIWTLETAVTDSLRDLLRERRVREQVEWQVWPRGRDKEESMLDEMECRVCKAREKEDGENGRKGFAERVEEQRRENEIMQTQADAEERVEVANEEIARLQKEVKALAMLKNHKEDTEAELDMLKEGMKRIERIAMMYGPLEDELGLLDAVETWKLEFLAASTKRKKRRKKEEKHGLG